MHAQRGGPSTIFLGARDGKQTYEFTGVRGLVFFLLPKQVYFIDRKNEASLKKKKPCLPKKKKKIEPLLIIESFNE